MSSQGGNTSSHHELVSALLTLYTTMDSLALLGDGEDKGINFPPHPEHMFNVENALEAGFTQAAIDTMLQIPYLEEHGMEITPNTPPMRWMDEHPTVEFYRDERVMLPGRDESDDDFTPPQAVKITGNGLYSAVFVYDTTTKLVHPWHPWEDEGTNYYHEVAGKKPWDVFGPIILSFQRLENLGEAGDRLTFFGPEGYQASPIKEGLTEEIAERNRKVNEILKKRWEVRDIYLECGWDVEAEGPVQPTFRREEFIARREDYLRKKLRARIGE